MKNLSVPYNQDPALVDFYIEHKDRIYDMYFPAHPSVFRPSARMFNSKLNEEEHAKSMGEICRKLTIANIKPVLLFNGNNKYGMITESEISRLDNYLTFLIIHGLETVVVSDPFLIPFFKYDYPELKVRSSVLFDVYNVDKVKQLEKLGIDEICLKNDLCRDMKTLRKIRASTSKQLSVICNTTCTYSCAFYQAHHAIMSVVNPSNEEIEYIAAHNNLLNHVREGINMIKCPFIRPEDLWYYEDCINVFKLEGRQRPTEEAIMYALPYINRKTPKEGILSIVTPSCGMNIFLSKMKMDIPDGFVEKVANCDRDCDNCRYCDNIVDHYTMHDLQSAANNLIQE